MLQFNFIFCRSAHFSTSVLSLLLRETKAPASLLVRFEYIPNLLGIFNPYFSMIVIGARSPRVQFITRNRFNKQSALCDQHPYVCISKRDNFSYPSLHPLQIDEEEKFDLECLFIRRAQPYRDADESLSRLNLMYRSLQCRIKSQSEFVCNMLRNLIRLRFLFWFPDCNTFRIPASRMKASVHPDSNEVSVFYLTEKKQCYCSRPGKRKELDESFSMFHEKFSKLKTPKFEKSKKYEHSYI